MRLLFVLIILALASPVQAACELCGGVGCALCAASDNDPTATETVANTYSLSGGQWPQLAGDGSPVTLTYSYNNLLDGGLEDINGNSLSVDYLRGAVEEALGLWAAVAPLHFVEVEDIGTQVYLSSYPDGPYGQIRLNHRYINGPDPAVGSPTTKALGYYPYSSGALAGDIHFDNGDPWSEFGTLSQPDVLGAVTHELGHALGLGHDSNSEANMYWIFRRTIGLGDGWLHPSDIAGIRAIYGEGVGSVTPLRMVPEPNAATLAAIIAGLATIRFRLRLFS